jgi:hypothetical protein
MNAQSARSFSIPCLQSMAKVSSTVHGLAWSVPSVHRSTAVLVSVVGVMQAVVPNLQPHLTWTWTSGFAPGFRSGSVADHAWG